MKVDVIERTYLVAIFAVILPIKSFALAIYDNETDFFSSSLITSTETFDTYTNNYGFISPIIAIDGVQYETNQCTNRCWNFDGSNVTPQNGLISNAIGYNKLGAGEGRYFDSIGFYFLGLGKAGSDFLGWDMIVTEQNGVSTNLAILPDPIKTSTLSYYGFTSSSGISNILLRDNYNDSGAVNWVLDNVSHGTIFGGDMLLV